jgi:site-specific DNA-methyltransferase (adenine-specific)
LSKKGILVVLLLNGDCLEEMQKLIDDGTQVDSVVTDPPYHLTSITERFGKEGSAPAQYGTDGAFARASKGFMGKEWDGGDIAFRKETWELALKLLKPGGHLLAFSGSRTYHRMAVAIEDAGFEIRDQIMWIYGSGFPKSLNIGKAVDKKLGNERVTVGERTRNVKPFDDDNGWNSNNTTGNYIYTKGNTQYEGWGTALKPAHEPIVLARKPISEKSITDNVLKHETGGINIDACRCKDNRYPANVIHDGLQEDWARYFYCPKTSKAEKNQGLENFTPKPMAWSNQAKAELKRGNLDFVGSGDGAKHNKVAMRVNTHPTVKPQKLMQYLCRLVTPKNGTVLDLFMGSGSTGIAAKDEGFDFIGIEKDKEYFEIAGARIKSSSPLLDCFE